jgi:double-stranded uracil-DNA glycosylase
VSPEEFRKARPGLEAKMRRYAPRSIAFLGKRAFSAMIDQSDVELGRHPTRFAGATAWVLPNPSGFNKAFTLDGLMRLVDGPPRRTVAAGVLIMMAADDTHRDRRAG